MPTNYPNSLDDFINPQPTDSLNSPTAPHAEQHTNLNDAVESIQTVLGLNPAGSHLTVKDRIINAEQQISSQAVLNGLTDVTINQVGSGDVLRFNGTTWINYTEQDLVDGGNF
jgi:hypothetical protein